MQQAHDPAARLQSSAEAARRLDFDWQNTQLTFWLLACSLGLPDTALSGLGLRKEEAQDLLRRHPAEVEQMQSMLRSGRAMQRERVAELLRARVCGMSFAARTPVELAAVARTVRSLPDWVWDGANAGACAVPPAAPQPGSKLSGPPAGRADCNPLPARLAAAGPGSLSEHFLGSPLNRQQRRALESQLRKTR